MFQTNKLCKLFRDKSQKEKDKKKTPYTEEVQLVRWVKLSCVYELINSVQKPKGENIWLKMFRGSTELQKKCLME